MTNTLCRTGIFGPLLFVLGLLGAQQALAVQPDVKTVPWVATDALIPHSTWSGKEITLKGTVDTATPGFEYTWDFGDGTPVVTAAVSNNYVLQATHTYIGTVDDIFTARLTVEDTNTGETDSEIYLVQIQAQNLETEVNVAIDEGLWYLHTIMNRFDSGGQPTGNWTGGEQAITAFNVTAFLVNGHLEGGDPSNPYTETAQRGVNGTLNSMLIAGILSSQTNPLGSFNPDHDGNLVGVTVSSSRDSYQLGGLMDAIVATNSPDKVVTVAPFVGRTDGTGAGGEWTYFDVVQNLADYYSYCQYDFGTPTTQPPGTSDPAVVSGGGWGYSCNSATLDGSIIQWAAIGLLAAERQFNVVIDPAVKGWLRSSTDTLHNAATGQSGYTSSTYFPWGAHAVTPSGTVQMTWNGYGRGTPMWDSSENYLRSNFCNTGGASSAIRDYYYGLFSFTKSMLLHDTDADAVSEPIKDLECRGAAPCALTPIDWYAAEVSAGAQCDGVARTLVNDQAANGSWSGHNFSTTQYVFETGWAIIMLNRTVFASGLPVAVAQAIPNPAVAGQTITLDGSSSFHQDLDRTIDSWEWDLDNDGAYDDATGPVTTTSFPALGDYPVGLRVTDDGNPEESDTTVVIVQITLPPLAPTADADGPYVFCPAAQPWFLDGTGSVNPDEGLSEQGLPGDTIQEYAWELSGDGAFDDAFGAQPDVTAFFNSLGIGDYLIQLRVTDTTATSFPSSGMGDLSDVTSAQVAVKDANDPACSCIDDLRGRPKILKAQMVWTDTGAAGGYNVYRSTTQGGPYTFLGNTTSTYSTYLDAALPFGNTFYYVVRPASLAGDELCQSNELTVNIRQRTR